MGPAMHSPIGHFRKVLAQFSQLSAISFAQPYTNIRQSTRPHSEFIVNCDVGRSRQDDLRRGGVAFHPL